MNAYQLALKVMFRIDPERIHGIITGCLKFAQHTPFIQHRPKHDPVLAQQVFGRTIEAPLGLAAGFDKNAVAPDVWAALGFGHAEVGTVTGYPQPGNQKPRLFRLPADHAILNRMGFNNDGAAHIASALKGRNRDNVIGINIGKTKRVALEDAVDDYRRSATLLGGLADYLVVNVSSPNTPGLRDLQSIDSLRPILAAVQECTDTPVLVKIAPDLADDDVLAVADLALELGIAGIVATNTTTSRGNLKTQGVEKMGAGGISGDPVAARALAVLKLLHSRVGDQLVLIGVGGISTPQQAWERIAAGATLLEGYTPMIYGGPGWIRGIHHRLAQQVKKQGLTNISEAVGSGLEWKN